MRTYIDLGVGVVSISRDGSDSGATTNITPPLEALPDLSEFGQLDLELRILNLSIEELGAEEHVVLYFETSMQNNEEAPEFWALIDEFADGLELDELTAPVVFSMTISATILRYMRWRLNIPPHASAPPVSVKLVFQLRGYGRT